MRSPDKTIAVTTPATIQNVEPSNTTHLLGEKSARPRCRVIRRLPRNLAPGAIQVSPKRKRGNAQARSASARTLHRSAIFTPHGDDEGQQSQQHEETAGVLVKEGADGAQGAANGGLA